MQWVKWSCHLMCIHTIRTARRSQLGAAVLLHVNAVFIQGVPFIQTRLSMYGRSEVSQMYFRNPDTIFVFPPRHKSPGGRIGQIWGKRALFLQYIDSVLVTRLIRWRQFCRKAIQMQWAAEQWCTLKVGWTSGQTAKGKFLREALHCVSLDVFRSLSGVGVCFF